MSRALVWLAAALFSLAWYSVFFSLTAFGVLIALSAAFLIVGELIWHFRYRDAYQRHPSNVVDARRDFDEHFATTPHRTDLRAVWPNDAGAPE